MELGLHAIRPSSLEINLDRQGIVQDVKPELVFRREKSPLPKIPVKRIADGYVNAISLHPVSRDEVECAGSQFVLDSAAKCAHA